MVLLQDVVQVLDRPMSAAAMQRSLSLHREDRRVIDACLASTRFDQMDQFSCQTGA